MKKLLTLCLLAAIAFVGISVNVEGYDWETSAPFDDFKVGFFTDIDEYYLTLQLSLYSNVSQIAFTIPESDTHALESSLGSYDYEVVFYDSSTNEIDRFEWKNLFTINDESPYQTRLAGDFELSIDTLGLKDEGVALMTIILPQNAGQTDEAGYTSYIEDNDYALQRFGWSDHFYTFTSSYNDFLRAELTVDVPPYADTIWFEGLGSFYYDFVDPYSSSVKLYDASGTLLDLINLTSISTERGQFFFVIPYDDYDYEDVATAVVYLYSKTWNYNHDTLADNNENIVVEFDNENIRTLHFISQGVEVHSEFLFLPTAAILYEPTPPTGFIFDQWVDIHGLVFDFLQITATDYEARDIYVYASYVVDFSDAGLDIDDPVLDTDNPVLAIYVDLGWNTPTGFTLSFLLIIVIVTILLAVVLNLPLFAVMLVDFLFMVLFVHWGMLPTFVAIIGYILFGILGILSLTGLGGQQHE